MASTLVFAKWRERATDQRSEAASRWVNGLEYGCLKPGLREDHRMQEAVYRVLTLVSALVVDVPIETNLGLLHLFWMLLCGKLLLSRGAIFPGLSAVGLSEGAVRRAWAALGHGSWTSDRLVRSWARVVEAEGFWQPHRHGGYHPVAGDITGFWRPRLQGCPTS